MGPNPLSSLKVSRHQIPAHGLIPNTSIQRKPLLIYHAAFASSTSASAIEKHLFSIGAVTPQWRFTMYSTTHFHSTSHEVLCISNGSARLCFGGDDNEGRVEPVVEEGDVIIVPAGVSHRLVRDREGDFEMVGSYPPGYQWDMCYGKKGEEAKSQSISKLPWFETDPIYGEKGPALEKND